MRIDCVRYWIIYRSARGEILLDEARQLHSNGN